LASHYNDELLIRPWPDRSIASSREAATTNKNGEHKASATETCPHRVYCRRHTLRAAFFALAISRARDMKRKQRREGDAARRNAQKGKSKGKLMPRDEMHRWKITGV